MRKQKGFTLIELMIVVAIIAIIAAIAIPNLLRSRMAANESASIGSLKTIATQQAIFKQQGEVDQDSDGIGEQGLLGELSGAFPCRGAAAGEEVKPVYISQAFRTTGSAGNGLADKSGFYFRMYLAVDATGADDDTMGGTVGGAGGATLDPSDAAEATAINLQESSFACYAWPVEFRSTGQRAFVVNEIGEVYGTKMDAKTYSSTTAAIDTYNAGYDSNADDTHFNDPLASGTELGMDGNTWNPAGG